MDHGYHRNTHQVSSDIHSQTAHSVGSSTPNHTAYDSTGPSADLPSTTHLLQQMDAAYAGGMGGLGDGGGPGSDVSLFDALLFPRSHSDPHVQVSPRPTNGTGAEGPPSASRRLMHSKTMQDKRVHPVRVHAGGGAEEAPPQWPPARLRVQNGAAEPTGVPAGRIGSPRHTGGGEMRFEEILPMAGMRAGRVAAAAAAADTLSNCDSDGSSGRSVGFLDAGLAPTMPDVSRGVKKKRSQKRRSWRAAEGGEAPSGRDSGSSELRRSGDGGAAADPRNISSWDRRPPVGPSAAAARREGLTDPVSVPESRVSAEHAQELWNDQQRTSNGAHPAVPLPLPR